MNVDDVNGAGGAHPSAREDLGAYALGLLGTEDHRRVSDHLAGCADCRAELAEIAPLAPLLRQVQIDRLDAPPDAGPDLTPELARAITARSAEPTTADVVPLRVHRRRLTLVGGIAAAVVLLAGASGFALGRPAPGPFEVVPVMVAGPAPAVATAGVVPHTWGMEIRLTASGFTAGQRFLVSVRDTAGGEHAAGEFIGTGSSSMVCNLNSSVLRSDASGFTVADASGRVVLSSSF